LPLVIDDEEINILKESKNKRKKKDKGFDFLGMNINTDITGYTGKYIYV
jgi:hypothetical protein